MSLSFSKGMENNFKSWLLSHGGRLHSDVNIAFDSHGFCLHVCKDQDLPQGCCVISCPHTLTISWINVVQDSFFGQFISQSAFHLVTKLVMTRFFLVKQFMLHGKSFWWPYIQLLPQPEEMNAFNSPLWYNAEDLAWIRGTNLEFGMKKMEALWRQEYEEAMELFKSIQSPEARSWSWPLYKWSAAIFTSRSFPGSALAHTTAHNSLVKDSGASLRVQKLDYGTDLIGPILIPGVDLLNHCPLAKVTWSWGRSDCALVNDDLIRRNTQVWNNYGPKSNEELILGYGFSLFRNSADFCSLAISQIIKQRIATLKDLRLALRRPESLTDKGGTRSTSAPLNLPNFVNRSSVLKGSQEQYLEPKSMPDEANIRIQLVSQEIEWVRLRNSSLGDDSNHGRAPYYFSRGFLGNISIAFANKREIAKKNSFLDDSVDFLGCKMSRNTLNVICAVIMILQRQQMNITKHDTALPAWPQNEKQFHAARYRRNQVNILSSVIGSLMGSLRALIGLNGSTNRDMRIICLEHILTDSSQAFLADFRAALNASIGTRNPEKIRSNGWVECTFTLWLCGHSLWHSSSNTLKPVVSLDSTFSSKIAGWLTFLRFHYGDSSGVDIFSEPSPESRGKESDLERKPENTELQVNSDDIHQLAQSYLSAAHAAVRKHPRSLYGHPDVTVTRLTWCLHIIREEGIMCPNLKGKPDEENDQFILFMEDSA